MNGRDNQSPSASPTQAVPGLPAEFRHVVKLGGGEFGIAHLYVYEGNDEKIKGLCIKAKDNQSKEHDVIVVKAIKIPENEEKEELRQETKIEIDIGTKLYNEQTKSSSTGKPAPYALNIGFTGNEDIILSKPIAHSPININQNPKMAFGNLDSYLTVAHQVATVTSDIKIKNAFTSELSTTLTQISSSMVQSLNEMHKLGLVHGDVAGRNYFVNNPKAPGSDVLAFTATIADFGKTREMTRKGPENALSGYVEPASKKRNPFREMNIDAMELNEEGKVTRSVATDLMGLRITMMTNVGFLTGAIEDRKDITNLGDKTNSEYFDKRFEMSDNQVLSHYLQNLETAIDKKYTNDRQNPACQEAKQFINGYKEFITNMPEAPVETMSMRDVQAFEAASAKFVSDLVSSADKKIQSAKSPQITGKEANRLVSMANRLLEVGSIPEEQKQLLRNRNDLDKALDPPSPIPVSPLPTQPQVASALTQPTTVSPEKPKPAPAGPFSYATIDSKREKKSGKTDYSSIATRDGRDVDKENVRPGEGYGNISVHNRPDTRNRSDFVNERPGQGYGDVAKPNTRANVYGVIPGGGVGAPVNASKELNQYITQRQNFVDAKISALKANYPGLHSIVENHPMHKNYYNDLLKTVATLREMASEPMPPNKTVAEVKKSMDGLIMEKYKNIVDNIQHIENTFKHQKQTKIGEDAKPAEEIFYRPKK